MGVGEGSTLNIMDVRYDRKLFSIRSAYNEPINSIHFMDNAEKNILFSNKKQIKITDGNGKFFTSIEPDQSISMLSMELTTGLESLTIPETSNTTLSLPIYAYLLLQTKYIEFLSNKASSLFLSTLIHSSTLSTSMINLMCWLAEETSWKFGILGTEKESAKLQHLLQ